MNEFEKWWMCESPLYIPKDIKELELYAKAAYLGGAAAMRDKAADTCTHMRYATNQECAAAVRKLEVE